ncbi:MAG: hypothetical protein AAF597_19160, partial [Bacteroidota bacterium]
MILDHRHFSLAGRHTFDLVRAQGPFRARVVMPDEACFYYLLRGEARTYAPKEKIVHPAGEGVALRCGNYLTDFLNAHELGYFEVITIHFSRELLRDIFADDFPQLRREIEKAETMPLRRFDTSELFAAY